MQIIDLRRWSGPYPCPIPHVYCGRRMGGKRARDGSPLANRFKRGEHADPIGAYRKWLFAHIAAGTPSVMRALAEIAEDTTLACWCVNLEGEAIFSTPEVCHCQVIAKAARWLALKTQEAVA
jgi:hypothetical protein